MIKFSEQVPSIYPNASRDFQYLGWLIDIVLNSVKHNVDSLYQLPILTDDVKIAELLAMTLGFKVKRNYDKKQLAALVSILPSILKYKGTISAITTAAEALVKASGAIGDFRCEVNGAQIEVILPEELVDTTLFIDLLEYILPAGMTCRITRDTQFKRILDDILVSHYDKVHFEHCSELEWTETNESTGLSVLMTTPATMQPAAITANFSNTDNAYTLNSGLFSNTVIPILPTTIPSIYDDEKQYSNVVDHNNRFLVSADGFLLFVEEPVEPQTNLVDALNRILASADDQILACEELKVDKNAQEN